MPFRVSMFWKQQSSLEGGWSENYWNTLASIGEVQPKVQELGMAWFAYKGNPCYIPEYRITDVDNFRNAQLFRGTFPGPSTVTGATDADYPTTKGLMKFSAAQGLFTRQWAGGLRDRDTTNSGRWSPLPASVNLVNAVFAVLTTGGNGWAIRVLDPSIRPVAILAINNTTGIVTTAANTIADGSRVRIKGVRGLTEANGIWRVTKLSDITFQLNGWTASTSLMTKGNPTIRYQSYIFRTITQAIIERTTSHRVGKPTGLLGGRRRRRAS